jgi:hypothetical protein
MRRLPADPRARARRKQDLLLASGLAREQAVVAIGEIGQRADQVARALIQVRAWLVDPRLWLVGGVVASAVALVALPRMRSLRLVHWGLLAVRAWRATRRVLAGRRRAGPDLRGPA